MKYYLVGMWSIIISVIACIYLWVYFRIITLKPADAKAGSNAAPFVTILVCMRDEEDEIDAFVESVLAQKYPRKKLLLVDDQSADQTFEKMKNWADRYPEKIDLLQLREKPVAGKKGAIKAALPNVEGEVIVFTDVDCRPKSQHWLSLMVAPIASHEAAISLGYVEVSSAANWVGVLQQFQSFWKSMQFLGFAQSGYPYMAMGGNWAVRKDLYIQGENIQQHGHIASGDDDLVFQQLSKNNSVAVVLHQNAWVSTRVESAWRQSIAKRGRHMSTYTHYSRKWNIILFSAPMVMLCGILAWMPLLWAQPLMALLIFALYYIISLVHMYASAKVIPAKFPIWCGPLLLPFEFLFQGAGFLLTLSRNQSSWK